MARNSSSYTYTTTQGISSFQTVTLSGQSDGTAIGADIKADSVTDTLTLSAGPSIALISDPTTDTITISSHAGSGSGGGGGGGHDLGSGVGLSGEWKSAYTDLNANSANWDAAISDMTNVANMSANWNSVYTSVDAFSALWESNRLDLTEVANTSANWNAAIDDITSLANTSADWNSVFVTVTAGSAQWAVDTTYTAGDGITCSNNYNFSPSY